MGRKLKFPAPKDYRPSQPAIICPAQRVIGLYNQESDLVAKKISKKVRIWFAEHASSVGWAGIHFVQEVQSDHGAGCILWRAPETLNIQITGAMLILAPYEPSNDDGAAV